MVADPNVWHSGALGKRSRKRNRQQPGREAAATTEYRDAVGNGLTLRDRLSGGTAAQLQKLEAKPAASAEDRWQRRTEFLFERLAVRWTVAGLPIESQRELLGRYRMASAAERRWIRETIDAHLKENQPELLG